MRSPCEKIIWYLLPAIRKELVRVIVKEHDFNQRETAKLIGVSDAAVSQYLSKKRGRTRIKDKKVLAEISKSAKTIIKKGKGCVNEEVCRLCAVMRESRSVMETLSRMK